MPSRPPAAVPFACTQCTSRAAGPFCGGPVAFLHAASPPPVRGHMSSLEYVRVVRAAGDGDEPLSSGTSCWRHVMVNKNGKENALAPPAVRSRRLAQRWITRPQRM